MKPVLFLDIDDVLCLNAPYGGYDAIDALNGRHPDAQAVYRRLFAPQAVAALRSLHQTLDGQLAYVISSTWRLVLDRSQLCEVFSAAGLDFLVDALEPGQRWCTPVTQPNGSRRAHDIAAWLDCHHRGEPFAIVDDFLSGQTLVASLFSGRHAFYDRVVLCDVNVGLVDDHLPRLAKALSQPAQAPGVTR
jgi:hypothetical protein